MADTPVPPFGTDKSLVNVSVVMVGDVMVGEEEKDGGLPPINTVPAPPAAVTCMADAPFPYSIPLAVNEETPVPPFATVKSLVNVNVVIVGDVIVGEDEKEGGLPPISTVPAPPADVTWMADAPLPYNTPSEMNVDTPVPPSPTAKSVPRVSAPVNVMLVNVGVAVQAMVAMLLEYVDT